MSPLRFHLPLFTTHGTRAFSSGILMAEAAIATLVFSFFASSSPSLFTAKPAPSRPTTAQTNVPQQNQSSMPPLAPTWSVHLAQPKPAHRSPQAL